MLRLPRWCLPGAAAFLLSLSAHAAVPLDDAALDRLILGLDDPAAPAPPIAAPSVVWFQDARLAASVGYKDNVLFAPIQPAASGFLHADLDYSIFVTPPSGVWTAFALVQAENESYFDRSLSDQRLAFATLGGLWKFQPTLTANLQANAAYTDQYFGLAVSDALLETVGIAAVQTGVTPSLAWAPSKRWSLTLSAPASLYRYENSLYDYDEIGSNLTVAWTGTATDLTLSTGGTWRPYAGRPIYTPHGFSILGTSVDWRLWETTLQLRHRLHWLSADWETSTRAGLEFIRDGAYRYDDNTRFRLSQKIEYTRAPWHAALSGWFTEARYDVQATELLSPDLRRDRNFSAEFELARDLPRHWQLFARARAESLRTNRAQESYQVLGAQLGLAWTFSSD